MRSALSIAVVAPANRPPTAKPVAASTGSGVPVAVLLTGSDPEGAPITPVLLSTPAHGSWNNGVYTPTSGFVGTDRFLFTVSDGLLQGATAAEATITVTASTPGTSASPGGNGGGCGLGSHAAALLLAAIALIRPRRHA
jgi:hypothetical protein